MKPTALALYTPPQQKVAPVMHTKSCAHCKRPVGNHFKVTRYTAGEEEKGSVTVCSLFCLLNWTYTYSTSQGLQLVQGVSSAFANLVEAFRGLKK